MPGQRKDLQEDLQFRVLRVLENNPETSQRELARYVGTSVGGAHYIINALVEKGLVKLGKFSAATDKRRYAYILTPKGVLEKAAITKKFLVRKTREYEALKKELKELRDELDTAHITELSSLDSSCHKSQEV